MCSELGASFDLEMFFKVGPCEVGRQDSKIPENVIVIQHFKLTAKLFMLFGHQTSLAHNTDTTLTLHNDSIICHPL